MIRDDDLAWARDIVAGKRRGNADAVLARLVLHIHEQEQSVPLDAILASAPGAEPGGIEGLTDDEYDTFMAAIGRAPLPPPPEAVAWAEVERLRAALRKISEWDMLNPPQTHVVSDLDWLRRLVDDALTATETADKNEEAYEALKARASSPPPEAVEWAEWVIGQRSITSYADAVAAARFILHAAGKDTDE